MKNNLLSFKQKVARSFNRAASHYEDAAKMQKMVGKKLLDQCHPLLQRSQMILDLGCGTGFIGKYIAKKYNHQAIFAFDIAENMLLQNNVSTISRFCADADHIPLPANQIDFAISNLALQWSPNLKITLKEIRRVLKQRGRCHFSTLGPRTLIELRNCWKKVDDATHINQFISIKQIKKNLSDLKFSRIKIKNEIIRLTYPNIYALMKKLKQTGAHNVNSNQPKSLLGKRKLQRLYELYERYCDSDQRFPATYEIIYVDCEKTL